jgi:branched-chain amino acid transport system substrate-binding protein
MFARKSLLWRLLALLVALTLVAAACGDDDDDDDATGGTSDESSTTTDGGGDNEGDGTLKIGYLLPQTGDLSFLGPPMIKGVEMALRDINAAGGVLDKDVELEEADDGTAEDVASQATDGLLDAGVDAIIGAAGSTITLAVIDKITGAGVVECSPSNTGANLTDYEDEGFYFRTAPPDNLQGQALGDLITDDGHSDVGIIAINNDYGKGFAEFLEQRLDDNGASVVATSFYDPNGDNFDTNAAEVAEANPEAVAVIAYPETGGQVFSAMIANEIGPEDVQVYITDGLQSDKLYENIDADNPAVTQGVRGTAPSSAPENGAAFFPDAFAEFAPDVDTIFSAHAYDCATVIALAALTAESDAPGEIQAEMNNVTREGEKCDAFDECAQLIADGEDIDYDGAAGPLDFVEQGEPGAGTYDIYEYGAEGGYETESQVVIEPEE